MALFENESERGVEPRIKPQSTAPQAIRSLTGTADGIPAPASQAALASRENRAYLDKGCVVKGKISFKGSVRIDGEIEGEINSEDNVAIGEGAVISANIKAVSIVVAGAVSGELSASQRIELYPSAQVLGNLTAPRMVIHEGAVFQGTCIMQPKTVREERKPAPSRKDDRIVSELNAQERAGQVSGPIPAARA
ncbi:MAG TPA: polymer-forming cytoskeletal protein [Candidatus Binataceae bacterium]|nr:polymer-forming cytoskeletal protein [Candidatus Binataceae bacterium]